MAHRTLEAASPKDNVANNGCYSCGQTKRSRYGPLVSADVVIDGEGVLYLCARCILNMGRAAGLLSEEDATALKTENKDLKSAKRGLTMRLGKANKALAAMDEWREANNAAS